jgi:hypothetical protein
MQAMDIIAVNNNAVNLMRQGSLHTAIPSFHSALRELHRIVVVQQQNMKVGHSKAPIAPTADHAASTNGRCDVPSRNLIGSNMFYNASLFHQPHLGMVFGTCE